MKCVIRRAVRRGNVIRRTIRRGNVRQGNVFRELSVGEMFIGEKSVGELSGYWLMSKLISNIYLRVTVEKNCRSQNFDFLSLNNLYPVGELSLTHISLNFHTFCSNLKIKGLGTTVCGFFVILILTGVMQKYKLW